jgi:hypothetical protein
MAGTNYTITTTRVDNQLRVYAASQILTAEQILATVASYPATPYYLAGYTPTSDDDISSSSSSMDSSLLAVAPTGDAATAAAAAEAAVVDIEDVADEKSSSGSSSGGQRRRLREFEEMAGYTLVGEEEVKTPPYNMIGRLWFDASMCTAQFISPVDVLTAAHCFTTNFAGMAFQPGQYGDDVANFGT